MGNMKELLSDLEEQKLQEMADRIEAKMEEDEQLEEVKTLLRSPLTTALF